MTETAAEAARVLRQHIADSRGRERITVTAARLTTVLDAVENSGHTAPAPQAEEMGSLKNALEMTGCDDEADLIDMANVGNSLMDRIEHLVSCPGPYHQWSPADNPAEIVFDLVNDLDETREALSKALAALKHARDQIRHPDQLIDEAIAAAEARAPTPRAGVIGCCAT